MYKAIVDSKTVYQGPSIIRAVKTIISNATISSPWDLYKFRGGTWSVVDGGFGRKAIDEPSEELDNKE